MENLPSSKSEAGKGDRPRNCFSNKYRNNYDLINWKKRNSKKKDNTKSVK